MDSTVVKLMLLWIVFDTIDLAKSIPLESSINPKIRTKRSPANNFSFFGVSPFSVPNTIAKARESINSFGNILAPIATNERIRNHQSSINLQTTNNRPFNAVTPKDNTYRNGLPNLFTQHLENADKNIVGKEHSSHKNSSKTNLEAPEQNDGVPREENETQNLENIIDKKLLDHIFQTTPDNNIDYTTVDTTIDFTTETGDYESTTSDALLRIPAPVVASLLG